MVLTCLLALAACERSAPNADLAADSSAAAPADTPAAPRDTAWVVTTAGFGPIRIGMSVAEGHALFGDEFGGGSSECEYASAGMPPGTHVLFSNGRIARVDVTDSSAVATAEGARIGDSEDRIRSLYAGRVKQQPHKYTDGHYLVVTPSVSDTNSQIVFETDGERVTRYRAGVLPVVGWVEGCS